MRKKMQIHFVGNTQFQLLRGGVEFFPALIAAIEQAQQEICLETYIYADDATTRTISAALAAAAARGVKVRLITDWAGSNRSAAQLLQAEMLKLGVEHRLFNPSWFTAKLGFARNHRKTAIIDQRLGWVGGINIIDDYRRYDSPPDAPLLPYSRWDFAVQMQGSLIAVMHDSFNRQWRLIANREQQELAKINYWLAMLQALLAYWKKIRSAAKPAALEEVPEEIQKEIQEEILETGTHFNVDVADGEAANFEKVLPAQHGLASFITRDNWRGRIAIHRMYRQAFQDAQEYIFLTTPYFAPGVRLKHALVKAARRGVNVVLLLGVGEIKLQDWVARSFYRSLLKAGVTIYEYRKTELHAKLATVDGRWVTMGSANCDGFSLNVNHEANVIVRDAEFTSAVEQEIRIAIQDGGEQVLANHYLEAPWLKQAAYTVAYYFYRYMMRTLTLGRYE